MNYEPQALLSTRKLQIGYPGKKILPPLNLHLYPGELVCLIGQNGCGKSTLLRTLSGLQKALAGNVCIKEEKLSSLSLAKRARLIGLVLTDPMEIRSLTVQQLVAMGRQPYTNWFGQLRDTDQAIIRQAIDQVRLTAKTHCRFSELSDGEKQRTLIAKALAQDTPLILLDEPTAHLDLPNKISVQLLLRRLAHDTGKAILLSSHELSLSMQIADKLWLMNPECIQRGCPEDMVLEGKVQANFNSPEFSFDETSGQFHICHTAHRSVCLYGNNERLLQWTRRALERQGYAFANDAPIRIEITDKPSWIIYQNGKSDTRYHIENLLFVLQKGL